jgi:hypothetical protein
VPSAPYVVPPLLLILVLLVSAAAKVREPHDTSSVFRQLELPPVLNRLHVPRLLPYGELVVAAALFAAPDGWYLVAATVTLLLFVAYLVVIARALRLPWPVQCGCFGRLGLGEVTGHTLVRNAVLVAVALVTWADAWRGDGVLQRLDHLGDDWWWLAGVALAVVTTGFVVRGDPRSQEDHVPDTGVRIPASEPGGYVARPTPYAVLDGPDGLGSVWQLSDTAARLLVFCDPGDPTARDLLGRLPGWADRLAPVRLHVVADHEWAALSTRHPELAGILLGDPGGEVRRRFGIDGRGAVLLGTDRFLAGGPVDGDDLVEELVEAAAEEIQVASAAVEGGQAGA